MERADSMWRTCLIRSILTVFKRGVAPPISCGANGITHKEIEHARCDANGIFRRNPRVPFSIRCKRNKRTGRVVDDKSIA